MTDVAPTWPRELGELGTPHQVFAVDAFRTDAFTKR
jgi:hypothetical protein